MRNKPVVVSLLLALVASGVLSSSNAPASAQSGSRTFPETGKTVKGRFLEYWNQNGALPQQGYPISEEMQERSDTDGKTYTVQYFERAVFEMHPENQRPFDVLLSLLGNFEYKQKYPSTSGAPNQKASTVNPRRFSETGKTLGGKFRDYWEKNGGLPQQGYPLSDEFQEKSDLDGKTYTVQYFERAVFELHPENAGTQFEVLLSQLGTFRYRAKYGQAGATPSATRAVSTPTRVPPTRTPTVAPPPVESPPPTSASSGVLMRGSFNAQPNNYSANGTATLVREADGRVILNLDLERVSSAPALVVWITETADPQTPAQMKQGGYELGALTRTSGRSSYALPSNIPASRMKTAVIYCKSVNVIISVAKMQTP